MNPYRRPGRWVHRNQTRITFAVFAAGAIVIGLWVIVLTGRVNRAESTRVATIQANYSTCVGSIPLLRQINQAFRGAETVADVLLVNAEAMHLITEPGTKVYRQQTINIGRLREAIRRGGGVEIPVPTADECKARRDKALG